MLVRVIGHTVDDGRENPTTYSLFTALLDPAQASAVDLAVAHTRRCEIELTFDELKTHQRGPRTVLRSKSPDLVPPRELGTPVLPLRDPLHDGRGRHPSAAGRTTRLNCRYARARRAPDIPGPSC